MKKIFSPRIEMFSAFKKPFSTPCESVADAGAYVASACCACTACTACGGTATFAGVTSENAALRFQNKELRATNAALTKEKGEYYDAWLKVRSEKVALTEELARVRKHGHQLLSALSLRDSRPLEFNEAITTFHAALREKE